MFTSADLNSVLNKKVLNETFDIVRANRVGLFGAVGFGAPVQAYEGYKMSWLDAAVGATSSTVTADATAIATIVAVADGTKFRNGMQVGSLLSDEVMLVTGVSGNNLTVTRAFGGTAAALSTGDVLIINSVGRPEGSEAVDDGIYQPEPVENFFQTMDTAITFTRRMMATAQYGNTNDMTFQIAERLRQLAIQVNRALIGGTKGVATIDAKQVTYTGGLRGFTTQSGGINVNNSAAALTLEALNAANAIVAERGGSTDAILVGIKQARKLHALISSNYQSQRLSDWTADQGAVMMLPFDIPVVGGVNKIIVDTNVLDSELFMVDTSKISVVPMAAGNAPEDGSWTTMDATTPGMDGIRTRVVGDFAMQIRNAKTNMARLYNIG